MTPLNSKIKTQNEKLPRIASSKGGGITFSLNKPLMVRNGQKGILNLSLRFSPNQPKTEPYIISYLFLAHIIPYQLYCSLLSSIRVSAVCHSPRASFNNHPSKFHGFLFEFVPINNKKNFY